jgi:acetyl esterase/lipase
MPPSLLKTISVLCFLLLLGNSAEAATNHKDILARPHGSASVRITYGSDAFQVAELWLPASPPPHRVIVLLHGGCWLSDIPGLELMQPMAEALQKDGYAVWNLDYRRADGVGGGYPNTFQDVAHGLDHLRRIKTAYKLDLKNVTVIGHSAGGHLALWAAARSHLPAKSMLHEKSPLPLGKIFSLAGVNDLEAYRATGAKACAGVGTIDKLINAAGRTDEDAYADTSPAKLLPIGVKQIIVTGDRDDIIPPTLTKDYAATAKAKGDVVTLQLIEKVGHFEVIDPRSKAWETIRQIIKTQ